MFHCSTFAAVGTILLLKALCCNKIRAVQMRSTRISNNPISSYIQAHLRGTS